MAMDAASLAQVESLCDIFYNQPNNPDWARAKSHVDAMSTSLEHIPQCQYILDNSMNPYAQLLASTVLRSHITNHWNNFDSSQHLTIKEYLLQFLADKGPSIPPFVLSSIISLLCRITKQGWFDDVKHREIVTELKRFLTASVDHCIIGLRAFNQLVDELNVPTTGRTLTMHRKTAVSFRDNGLLDVAKLSIEVMNQVASDAMNANPEQRTLLGEQSLTLFCACLGFDFIGTNPDESAEDVGTIQVPAAWRDLVQESSTIELLMLFYRSCEPPVSSLAMKALVAMSSVRRSIFLTDTDRMEFLSSIMTCIRDILKGGVGLEHEDNYHEFCRLLGRLKANYQLSELISDDDFLEWLEMVGVFSETSFRQWQVSVNSLGYILQLWTRLVAAVPYVGEGSNDAITALKSCVMKVVVAYVESMLGSCSACIEDDSIDNPLDNEGLLIDQLEKLCTLVRYHYLPLAEFIVGRFDSLLAEYPNLLNSKQGNLQLVEEQLSFLCYLGGAVVGGQQWGVSHSTSTSGDKVGHERFDGMLSQRCMRISQLVEFHAESSQGTSLCGERLERACLYFQVNFRKTYLSDPPPSTQSLMIMGGLSDLSWDADGGPMTAKQRGIREMLSTLEMGNQSEVTNIVMNKVFSNFRYWQSSHSVLTDTMTLFVDLASGANCSKVLIQLPCCHTLLSHHTPEHFPFLLQHENRHLRSDLHQSLARLIFMQSPDTMDSSFVAFFEPIQQVFTDLSQLQPHQMRSDPRVSEALQGCCRDIRGICCAATSKKAYMLLLRALFPRCMPLLTRCVEVFHDNSAVMVAMFKCMSEVVNNKAQRASFGNNSAQGILLFREASSLGSAYALAPSPTVPPAGDLYKNRYKCVACCLETLKQSLSGGYVNFGVMALYGDTALETALDACLRLFLSVPLDDALTFPKLSRSYFSTMEILFQDHMGYLAGKDTVTFMKLIEVCFSGLQCEAPTSALSAQCIDHVSSYIVLHRESSDNEEMETSSRLQVHMSSNPQLLPDLISKLFELLLFGGLGNQWAVTRPVLSLLLADESTFNSYRQHLISTQSPENQTKLGESFDRLLADLDHSLDIANRDRFAQRLVNFRQQVREFLTL